jgi:hypothetical protein
LIGCLPAAAAAAAVGGLQNATKTKQNAVQCSKKLTPFASARFHGFQQLSPGGGLQRPHAVPKSSCKSLAKKHDLPQQPPSVASLIRNSWAKEAAAAFSLPR